ncbi:hypothetical protein MMC16_007451 [Acarospora aff. strigata]|nr:hypothetical protein [Acarospora aff. strigata]
MCRSLADRNFNPHFSSFVSQGSKGQSNGGLHVDTNSDEGLDIFNSSGNMAGTGTSSPFIKDEPEDHPFDSNQFMTNQQGYGMSPHLFSQQFGTSQGEHNGAIDPSELTMQNGTFGQFSFGSQQNLASSFNMGNSRFGDDELLDLDLDDSHKQQGLHGVHHDFGGSHNAQSSNGAIPNFYPDHGHPEVVPMSHQNQINQVFSHTPDGAPIQSPFVHGSFNYAQFGGHIQPQQLSQCTSPRVHSGSANFHSGSFDNSYVNARPRSNMAHGLDRNPSDTRNPMTPKTPALGGLNLGTPESGSFPSQPIHTNSFNQHHRPQKSLSNQWDSTPNSVHSFVDSPISSPGHTSHHAQISEILKSGKHASLPAKVDNGHSVPAYQTQEAKRRRRRESHNMVERRRRDNINERIQELSHLVPQHRLEDEKVRKHLVNNSPLSPTIGATGISPPQATSLLANGGRRATGPGNITVGIPIEEKDKGPNKGDILNGAVSWTRDLMWSLHVKLQQESELADLITTLGGTFPFEQTEDEKRMRTELLDAIENNGASNFSYSRGPGSGLRVPKHTNVAGDALNQIGMNGTLSPQSLSPGVQSGGSGANSGGHGQPQFWNHSGQGSLSFKEEDEYGMDMGQ